MRQTDVTLLALQRDTFQRLVAGSLGAAPDFDRVIKQRMEQGGVYPMAATLREQTAGRTAFSGQEFRQAAGSFATGVTVVTSRDGEHGYGMTANSFSSVSLDPPLVLVCVIARTEGSDVIERHGKFAVNILAADQEPISRYFASKDRPRGPDAFRDVSHSVG